MRHTAASYDKWAAAVLRGWGAWIRKASEPALPASLDLIPPEGKRFSSIFNAGGSVISPDGRTLAFVAVDAKGEALVHVRPLDSLEARALAFVAGGKLKRIDVAGGARITLCDARAGRDSVGGDATEQRGWGVGSLLAAVSAGRQNISLPDAQR